MIRNHRTTRRFHPVARAAVVLLLVLVVFAGCESLGGALGDLADAGQLIGIDSTTTRQIAATGTALSAAGVAIDAARSPFTPEQEYYVGRSVAATILSDYDVYDDPELTRYVNLLGQSLALASPRPVLYRGYVFLVLDSDEINAFASPGGHIFITRGMISLTESEDELAAVLAHEIGHVVGRHGLGNIKSSRVIDAVTSGLFDVLGELTPSELAEVTDLFGDTTTDVVDTLATRGYSGATERQADGIAAEILAAVGYDPYALVRVLENMDAAQAAEYEGSREPRGFSKTHPRPESRIFDLERTELRDLDEGGRIDSAAANRRYREALRNL